MQKEVLGSEEEDSSPTVHANPLETNVIMKSWCQTDAYEVLT